MNMQMRLIAGAIVISGVAMASPANSIGLHFLPDQTKKIDTAIVQIEPVQYRIWERSRNRLHLEEEAGKRKHTGLPQKHIDYCNQLVSGYRQWDNTIAVDRYTREQCFSPYYRAY